jgi:hypothetical protein
VSAAGTASSSGTSDTRPCTRRSFRGSIPSIDTAPWLTPSSPVIARIRVVLPAPLGPSNPVTPGPNEQLSSDSATLGPNHTETSVTSTVASVTKAGSDVAGAGAGGGGQALLTSRPTGTG